MLLIISNIEELLSILKPFLILQYLANRSYIIIKYYNI